MPSQNSTEKQKKTIFFLRPIVYIIGFVIALIGIGGYIYYQNWYIPKQVIESASENIIVYNAISKQSTSKGEEIITLTQQEPRSNEELLDIIHKTKSKNDDLSIFISEIIASRQTLNKGVNEDTAEFADKVVKNLENQENLMRKFQSYTAYQICLLENGVRQEISYERMIITLNSITQDISTEDEIAIIQTAKDINLKTLEIHETVKDCFSQQYEYLLTEEIFLVLQSQSDFYNKLDSTFNSVIENLKASNDQGVFESKVAIGELDTQRVNFFTMAEFDVIRTEPLNNLVAITNSIREDEENLRENLESIENKYLNI